MAMNSWMWASFFTTIALLLLFDLGIFNKKNHIINIKESLITSCIYILISLLFALWIYHWLGLVAAEEYLTGYIIEKSLSLDNIFVISLIFSYFKTPDKYQHRILFWGILGVLILRGLMIGLGAKLIEQFAWIIYIFSVFLVYTGIKMLVVIDTEPNISQSRLLKFLKKYLPITNELHQDKFFIVKNKKLWCTPLFLALVLIEFIDLIFAVDSVPAIFSITTNTYIVYTSNIFAIIGLRALYFALSSIIHRFIYLKHALALVLIFIGTKTFVADLLGLKKFPILISLSVTIGVIAMGIGYSIFKTKTKPKHRPRPSN